MIIFLILEHAIAKSYSYQPSIIISNPSPSVIHHLQLSIIIKYRSSSGIRHHHFIHHLQSSIIYSYPSSSNIDHLQASIIIRSSIIITSIIIKSSDHHQLSIILTKVKSILMIIIFRHFIARNDKLIIIIYIGSSFIIFHIASHISDLLSSLIYHHR